jgi:glycosyltransferase involved in cell wall biosynthesis
MMDDLLFERDISNAAYARGATAPLRVLSIAHSGFQHAVGRMRYEKLLDVPGLALKLVVPHTWREYGITRRADPPEGDLDVHIAKVRWLSAGPAKWYLHHYTSLGRILRDHRPDVIHLWEEPWSLVALQATWLRDMFLPKAALVLETDQNILRRLPAPFEWTRRHTLRRTDLLVARQAEAETVSRACGYAGPARFLGYGVDQTIFRPGSREQARKELGVAPDAFLIGYVGRIVRAKGIFDILDVVAASHPGIVFMVMGSGPDRAEFEARASQLGLGGRVRIFEPQPPPGVAAFMRALDVFTLLSQTLPSWKEQFGRVIIEAQACGVPVIGSDSGSIPEVVGQGGWIVPEADTAALAALVARLRAGPAEIHATAQAGLANVASRYTYTRIAEQLLDIYRIAAASPRCQQTVP